MYFLGSKERFSEVINSIIKDKFEFCTLYCEPFAGGLNILPLLDKKFEKYYINDLNTYMYNLYMSIRDDGKFVERIDKAKSLLTEGFIGQLMKGFSQQEQKMIARFLSKL